MGEFFQPRYDEERSVYRDCKWCLGKGCLSCPVEADKEYKRQFPDGPKPALTIANDDPDAVNKLMRFLSGEATSNIRE